MIFEIWRTFRLGLKSLFLHKLRSALAMLGILIGVTAVIWLVALGEGVSYQAQQQIKELGATNIIIKSVKPTQFRSSGSGGMVVDYGLTRNDFDRIMEIPTVERAVPMRSIRRQARSQGRTADIEFLGVTPEYMAINRLQIDRGRFIEDRDSAIPPDNVAVIGSKVAEKLFPIGNPIGQTIYVDEDFYVVIGTTKNRQASASIGGSLEGRDYNLDVYIPLATLRARIGDQVMTSNVGSLEGELVQLSQITVTAKDFKSVEETAEIIEILLAKYHNKYKKTPDYSITVPKELLKQAEVVRMMFNILLVLIAGISLVVGGIGIMNIMLATVTERTREIGIRRALGARRKDIVIQFLAETVLLSAIGGMLGVGLGLLCGPAITGVKWMMQEYWPDVMTALPPNIANLEPIVANWSVIAAFLISVCVGVIFGVYPAVRAARMDPIEALRHE